MNTASFITKGLRFRPYRTLFLLLGFAVGVMVMTVLLSVGSAVLDQAMDEDLTGGGDIVLLPAGIDVNVLKTGGVTAMNFDIGNARYLAREFLTPARIPGLRTVSPELTRTYATLEHGGREQLVRIDGVVPSRFGSLWPAFAALLPEGPDEKDYVDPDFLETLASIDVFHTPEIDSTQTWAEWHYFNYHDNAGRSLYVSINAVAFDGDIAASGYSRGMVLFQYVAADGKRTRMLDVLPGREIAASTTSPDLLVGLNAVRLDGGVYRVNVALTDSTTGRPITLELDLAATPHQYVPPVTPLGSQNPFGYVVPVVRGHMTGRLRMGGESIELDGVGYHDHNWGHFRDAVWDWGIVHLGDYTVLYGRFAPDAAQLAKQPVLFAFFDADGPRPFALTHSYAVDWAPGGANGGPEMPRSITLRSRVGQDRLELRIDVTRQVESETGGGKQGLFQAAPDARSFFIQMEGRARLTGSIDRKKIDVEGHAFSETFRIERQTKSRQD